MDIWWRTYSHTTLSACSEAVGLPPHTSGNSETGHLNIGAGRIVPQDLVFVNQEIANGNFAKNPKILEAFEHVKKNKSKLHVMGLVGDGHVHSSISHMYELLRMAKAAGIDQAYLDLFADGRDSEPNSAQMIFDQINQQLKKIGIGVVNFISGRYFAMDRDRNWGRTSRVYNALTKGEAEPSLSARDLISRSYLRNINDEFIEPHFICKEKAEKVLINDNDAVILFNFRPDRARQLSYAFTGANIPDIRDRKIIKNLYYLTFVIREPNPVGISAFNTPPIVQTLAEVISNNGLSQFHIAETEKYAHVTYFIDGGREKNFPKEYRIMIPSPKVSTYDLVPSMSGEKITSTVISNTRKHFDLIIVNFANADMVGHSGNFYSAVQAIEAVDEFVGKIVNRLLMENYTIFITSDHGNAEEMINPKTNTNQTEHTENPVPFVIISKEIEIAKLRLKSGGSLSNIAPTILEVMGLQKPAEMTAVSLIERLNAK
jgi:2,3-bisphosphoglycerate-independent phosphoglycerate mutase